MVSSEKLRRLLRNLAQDMACEMGLYPALDACLAIGGRQLDPRVGAVGVFGGPEGKLGSFIM